MARPERKWSDAERMLVKFMSAAAIPQDRIAKALKTDKETLEKHFRDELDDAADNLNAQVVGALYKNAMRGNVAAQIFWCKSRLRWRERDHMENPDTVASYRVELVSDGRPLRSLNGTNERDAVNS